MKKIFVCFTTALMLLSNVCAVQAYGLDKENDNNNDVNDVSIQSFTTNSDKGEDVKVFYNSSNGLFYYFNEKGDQVIIAYVTDVDLNDVYPNTINGCLEEISDFNSQRIGSADQKAIDNFDKYFGIKENIARKQINFTSDILSLGVSAITNAIVSVATGQPLLGFAAGAVIDSAISDMVDFVLESVGIEGRSYVYVNITRYENFVCPSYLSGSKSVGEYGNSSDDVYVEWSWHDNPAVGTMPINCKSQAQYFRFSY